MSDPVSKAEIEDVLSSIRRLVSENSGAIRRDKNEDGGTERLVLTPAFRVDEADLDVAESAEVADPQDDDAAPSEAAEEAGSIFAAVAAVTDAADDPAPAEAGADPESADGGDLAEESAASAELSPLEQRIAELEAVVSRSAAEFEPDGSEAEELPETFVFHHRDMVPETDADDADENVAEAPEVLAEEAEAPEPAAEPEPAPEPYVLEAVAEVADEVEDDTAASEPEALAAMDAAEMDDAEPAPEPEMSVEVETPVEDFPEPAEDAARDGEVVDADAADMADDWEEIDAAPEPHGDETVLDEDALREMVARMVREELQGSVGERITHNVRRMVRREIARALSLQDFD